MKHFENLIISASAGTGKTYRLSLEYIALILRYYEHEDFSLDGVLALTFTRKASYEIRERIISHLVSLIKDQDEALLEDLCRILERSSATLEAREEGALISAYQEIMSDKRKLQVMTIDSYISSIFRNIVRPLRSIDHYEIDQNAVNKRMPYLLTHLMQPEIRNRVDKLLQRRVLRTLDDYAGFFSALINDRWLYYVIQYRCSSNIYEILPGQETQIFLESMDNLLNGINQQVKAGGELMDYVNKSFREILQDAFYSPQVALQLVKELLYSPQDAHALLKVLTDSNVFNGTRIRKAEIKAELIAYQQLASQALADHLYFALFLPEQQEILELWGIILQEYDRLIYRYKNMTYADLSWFTFEALFSQEPPAFDLSIENTATEFYHFLSHRTRFMLIDEFQDTSLIQFNILKPIMEEICAGYGSKDLGGVIVVGDEKQSIFGWRGGERDLLLNLRHTIGSLSNATSEVLKVSWRSSQDMMHFINRVFESPHIHSYLQENDMQWDYPKGESALGDHDTTIELKCASYSRSGDLESKRAVYEDFVYHMILPALQENPDEKIAILCRKTDQLNDLQLILEEAGESSVFQPSASIVEHHLIKPLLAWMRFVSYQDWYSLLSFLRSDFLLLSSAALKLAVDAISLYEQELAKGNYAATVDFGEVAYLCEWLELSTQHSGQKPYHSLRELLGLLLREELYKSKRDQLNMEAFLALIKDWEMNYATMGARMADLLDYIDDNYMQEKFNQVSLEGGDRLQLLTIHKSKGLQFDRVFVYYDLSGTGGNDSRKLYWSYSYQDRSFHDIDAYALSYHYQDVLKHSSAKALWEQKQRQSLLEELNTLYVAFTRAKTSLHAYFSYRATKSWAEYYADKQEKNIQLPVILAHTCMEYFADAQPDANGIYRFQSSYPQEAKTPKSEPLNHFKLSLSETELAREKAINWDAVSSPKEDSVRDWKVVYLDKRQHLYGDIVHYYLSFIRYNSEAEHHFAALQCLNRYGSLLPEQTLHSIFESSKTELQSHGYLFEDQYDKVFTEFPINALRIDRLMVNSQKKEAVVIDYKTGGIYEIDQLDSYVAALKRLPAFRDYSFSSQYVNLKIH